MQRGLRLFLTIVGMGLSFSAAAAERTGGTLNALVNPEPPTLMLGVSQAGPVDVVGSKIYESLLTYDFSLTRSPAWPGPGRSRMTA